MRSAPILAVVLVCSAASAVGGYEFALTREAAQLQRNKDLVRQSHERVWNERDPARAASIAHGLYSPDFRLHNPDGDSVGVEQMLASMNENRSEFPDWNEHIDAMVAEGDLVAVRFTSGGTQAMEVPAIPHRAPAIPNRGLAVQNLKEMEIFRVADGKLAEQWDLWDDWDNFAKLGLFDPDHWDQANAARAR